MRILFLIQCLLLTPCGASSQNPRGSPPPATIYGSGSAPTAAADPTLTITALAVGQGDATLITTDTHAVLIDGGPPGTGPLLRATLAARQITQLDYLILTHYDLDHLGGAVELMLGPDMQAQTADDFMPRQCIDRGTPAYTSTLWSFRRYWRLRPACHRAMTLGEGITLGPHRLHLVAQNGHTQARDPPHPDLRDRDENGHSMVWLLTAHGVRYLHMGDLPGGGGYPPYQTIDLESAIARAVGPVTLLHAGHHGSRTSTNAVLLDTTRPEAVIISAGAHNDFGHPHAEVLDRLRQRAIAIWTTLSHHIDVTIAADDYTIQREPP